jgi:uncharacterized Zn ribbon protein
MYTDNWTSKACPGCRGDAAIQTVRADGTTLACPRCGHSWTARRMPSDAEAASIVRGSRRARANVGYHEPFADEDPLSRQSEVM